MAVFIVTPPLGKPLGWDLADAETEGWTGEMIRAHVKACKQAAAQPEPAQPPEPIHNQDYIQSDDMPAIRYRGGFTRRARS